MEGLAQRIVDGEVPDTIKVRCAARRTRAPTRGRALTVTALPLTLRLLSCGGAQGRRVLSLDLPGLIAGAQYRGEFEVTSHHADGSTPPPLSLSHPLSALRSPLCRSA